ncbi:MAG TPA: F0F1 ATP synthase subunit A [Candidatus Saccharimonadales bacterium]|nr:F0F1 ATP synthase subunit A [Candidatus Saccharimonadales bacterium]
MSSGPAVHVAPAGVLQIGGVTITNSILYGWICIVLFTIMLIWVARRVTARPKGGLVQFIEIGVDFITNLVTNAFDDKKVGRRYVPYFVTLFFFILFNTWLGLLPIVGEGFRTGETPLFRPFTGDLNATFAMAAVTMIVVYAASIRESGGLRRYLHHFFVGSPKNPLYLVIGLLEMFTDLTRVISLSLRLFLNVAIGEMVIAVFSYLGHIAAPLTALPFTIIELGIGALQSYIFVILSVMYLAIAVNHSQEHQMEHDDLTEDEVPETIGMSTENA